MHSLVEFFRQLPRRTLFVGGGILVLAVAVLVFFFGRTRTVTLAETPELAVSGLQAKTLYFNGRARPWLLAQRRDLLTPEDTDDNSDRTRAFLQAAQSPKLFRQLDRQYRFDALLLTGDPSEYRPLLEHLVKTKDWTVRYADHTSLVFRRDSDHKWTLDDFAPVRARFADRPAREQAAVRAQTAIRLLAAGLSEPAKQLLDEAAGLASREPHVANGLAMYYIDKGQWREASEQVERALSADSDFLPALATKTQLLYGMKRFSDAYDLSRQIIERVPDDPGLLFYHAKIAHEAHAYQAEIVVLNKLITMATAADRPIGGYQIYLGQAYASAGDAPRAVEAYMDALNDPDLPDDQRSFIRENIQRIKKRSGQ